MYGLLMSRAHWSECLAVSAMSNVWIPKFGFQTDPDASGLMCSFHLNCLWIVSELLSRASRCTTTCGAQAARAPFKIEVVFWTESVQFIFNFRNLKFKAFNKSSELKRYGLSTVSLTGPHRRASWQCALTVRSVIIWFIWPFCSIACLRQTPKFAIISNAFLISREIVNWSSA